MPKSIFLCPVCGSQLASFEQGLSCPKGHRFDRSSAGYVHLLPANKKHSKLPGDDKTMCMARNRFLSQGFYAPLLTLLQKLACETGFSGMQILDSGCGEGYYTAGIYQKLTEQSSNIQIAGIDISKFALKYAAKRLPEAEFAVASCYHLPLQDNCVDLIVNCFSPMAQQEFFRVLKKGGKLLYVVPAPLHLWEMKEILYPTPYQNKRQQIAYEGFELEKLETVSQIIHLTSAQQIQDLFQMTPYCWKTPQEGKEKLFAQEQLDLQIEFDVHIFQKKS